MKEKLLFVQPSYSAEHSGLWLLGTAITGNELVEEIMSFRNQCLQQDIRCYHGIMQPITTNTENFKGYFHSTVAR